MDLESGKRAKTRLQTAMKASTRTIRKMDRVSSNGPLATCTKEVT
jgi:hypothetical protein